MVLKEYRITSAEIILREDITMDQFIDVIEGNRKYMPVLYVFNKIDCLTIEELDILDQVRTRERRGKREPPHKCVNKGGRLCEGGGGVNKSGQNAVRQNRDWRKVRSERAARQHFALKSAQNALFVSECAAGREF